MTTLSIIIPAYNDLPAVLTCVNSLRGLSANASAHQWLVQDDCSPAVFLPALIPPEAASTERNPENLGFGPNCNKAAQRAQGDILFLVNQDIYAVPGLSEGWDTALLAAFDADPQVGIVGARLLFPDGRVQSAGGLWDAACQAYHPYLGWQNINYPGVATPTERSWVTGAALAIRREAWDRVGGFDPGYLRGYWEDADLCCQVREAGFKIWYEPRVTLIHTVGSTGGNAEYFGKNAQRFKSKWVDTRKIHPDVPTIQVRYWA